MACREDVKVPTIACHLSHSDMPYPDPIAASDAAAEEAACVTEALERCQTDLLCSACDGTIVANNTRMFLAEVSLVRKVPS